MTKAKLWQRSLPLFFAILIFTPIFSQSNIWTDNQQSLEKAAQKPAISLTKVAHNVTELKGVQQADHFSLDRNMINAIQANKPENFRLSLEGRSNTFDMLLTRKQVFTNDFVLRTGEGRVLNGTIDLGTHYFGVLANDTDALVSLSVFENQLFLSIRQGGKVYNLAKEKDSDTHILFEKSDIKDTPDFECQTDDNDHYIGNGDNKVVYDESNCVNMYVEVDNALYLSLGGLTATTDYVTGVFNEVGVLYANESINFGISELVVWDTTDPYTGPSTSDYLTQFRNHLNGNYNGDLAHLIGIQGGGGIAYVDVLCNSFYGVAYSAINTFYEEVPTYSWTVEVVTHEIGHNLGSPHTHACAWNGNNTAIDGCGPEAGYSEGCDGPLPNAGTIMSYCHLVSGIGIDFNLGFGTQPGDLIRDEVYNASCLSPCDSGCTEGDSCSDGDPCTEGETYDADCNCTGGTFQDADSDGVCDANDQCPGFDDNLIGTSCDDGDNCTIGDEYTSNCICEGTYVDADGDGFCVGEDPDDNDGCNPDDSDPLCNQDCIAYDFNNFEGGLGIWNDGGSDCARVNSSNSFSGLYSVRLRDNSGSSSSMFTDNLPADGAVSVLVEFVFRANSMEPGEDFLLELSTNGGSSYSTIDSWVSGVDFNNGVYYQVSAEVTGSLNNATRLRIRCDATSNNDQVYVDDVQLTICNSNGGGGDCTDTGLACDDGDPCTEGETYDADCNCNGGTFQDADGDGVCDANDQCPGFNDNLIGTSCDDGDNCTVGDVYTSSCVCEGTYQDADGDGFCVGDDADDNDPCVPDNSSPDCDNGGGGGCSEFDFNNLESGWGIWNDGGSDCARVNSNHAYSGSFCIRIRDNSGASSSTFTDNLALASYSSVNVEFIFKPNSMEDGEDFFLEISTNGGSSYSTVVNYVAGTDFENGIYYQATVGINNVTLTNNTRLRFRCDATSNADQIYLDDILIEACDGAPLVMELNPLGGGSAIQAVDAMDFVVAPNPVIGGQQVQLMFSDNVESELGVQIMDLTGRLVKNLPSQMVAGDRLGIDTYGLQAGTYLLVVRGEEVQDVRKLIIH